MMTASQYLSKFAAALRYEDIPAAVVARAKDDMLDTMSAIVFGARMDWSRMAADYAVAYGAGGTSAIIGTGARVHAPFAALANGVSAHAFEMDGTRDPAVGAHGGATLLPVTLALAQETGADGKSVIAAYVAGCEVLYRMAVALHECEATPEHLGFHNPGITGPFAAAIAAGRLLGLDAGQMSNALGIAGSLAGGLLAFTKSAQGGMVKRLHIGRANEAGILAARLAQKGYTGPENVLDGRFGVLNVFARKADPALLTLGLEETWETLRIGMKRYPFHMLAQTPVQALQDLRAEIGFAPEEIETILVEGDPKIVSHNNIRNPGDAMQAQYSVPFCIAMSLHRDPEDPRSFDNALEDAAIRRLCEKVSVAHFFEGKSRKHSRVTVQLSDGRKFVKTAERFKGMPSNPLTHADLLHKLEMASGSAAYADKVFNAIAQMDTAAPFDLPDIS